MNKLITTNLGGHPLTLNDLGFLQSANQDVFAAIVDSISNGSPMILKGVVKTPNGGNFDFSAGYVAVLGEVYYVPAAINVNLSSGAASLYVTSTTIAPSPVTYADLSYKDVHKSYRMQVVDSLSVPGGALNVLYSAFKTLGQFLVDRIQLDPYEAIGVASGSSFNTGWGVSTLYNNETVSCRDVLSTTVEFKGSVKIASYSDGLVMTLPTGKWPSKKRGLIIPYNTGDSSGDMEGFALITIHTNGQVFVSCDQHATHPALTLYFDGVKLPL